MMKIDWVEEIVHMAGLPQGVRDNVVKLAGEYYKVLGELEDSLAKLNKPAELPASEPVVVQQPVVDNHAPEEPKDNNKKAKKKLN